MKRFCKRILPLLILAMLLIATLPMQVLADTSWTEYGRSGHATASGDSVSFSGHPSQPFTTLLYRPAEDGDYRKFTFHLSEGNSDWHTLEGSGFVFNTDISGGVLNGYAVLFGQSNVGYYKLSNVAASALAGSHFTGVTGVSLIQQVAKPAFSAGTTWYLELLVSPGSMSFYVHADASFGGSKTPIFNNIAIDDTIGSGYGPFGSFISHDCSVISTSSFEYFRLTIAPNTPPVVTAPDVVLERGAAFDPKSGVSAKDNEDGDVSASIQIKANDVNTSVPGVYGVTYTATDMLGLAGTHTRRVTVRADVVVTAVDAKTRAPVPGVEIALGGTKLPATDTAGKTRAVLDPGAYDLSVSKGHPNYITPKGSTVAIDGAHFSDWPAQVTLEMTPKQYDVALSIELAQIGEASLVEDLSAKYGDILTYRLKLRNAGNQATVPTVALTIPAGLSPTEETAALLQDGAFTLEAISPGEAASLELKFQVAAISASTSLRLQASAVTVATPEGDVKTDIDPTNNEDDATTAVVNPPVVLTVINALDDSEKLQGAEIKIVDNEGKAVFTGVTGEAGTVKADGIYPGKYTIVQTKAVSGYQLPGTAWSFAKDDAGAVTGDTVLPNQPTLVKVTNVEVLADKTEKPLAGGKIIILDAGGKEVHSGTIPEDGTLTYRYLPTGSYVLKQTTAPAGYVLQTQEYPFTIDEAGKVSDTKIINQPTTVVILKTGPDKKPVEGASYEIYDAKKKAAEGKTDKDGKLTVTHLPAGKYTYKEVKAPSGYALNAEAYPFEIDAAGVVTGTLNVTDPFADIVIKKVDAKSNKTLAGAQFGLYDSSDKLITTLTTDKDGLARFTKLPWGKYSVKELKAPNGYAVSGKLVTVEITETYQNPAEPHIVENSPAAQTGRDGFPWWGIALLAVCVVGGGVCAWYLLRKKQPAMDKRRAKRR